jgi:hypothetical protein
LVVWGRGWNGVVDWRRSVDIFYKGVVSGRVFFTTACSTVLQ